ncbi:MAG: class I SAM-dependent DNA methyltransferase [Chloroflexaceae bacterium]
MIYDRYAAVYDGSGQVRFALLIAQYLEQLMQRHPVNGRRLLDLACGTGTLGLLMAGEGWQVTGIDASVSMLAQARAKLVGAELSGSLTLLHGDMRNVAAGVPPAGYDLVTCTYDSLNYLLTEDDLAAAFRSVAYALAPGGLFIGDMNTRYFLEHDWGSCEVHEQSGYTQVSQSRFDSTSAVSVMQLTGFIGNDTVGYTRFDETHSERGYPDETVAALIEQAGLAIEAAYDCFTFDSPGDTTQRIAWVARRP